MFSAPVLFVLTLSKCVCCRLGEMKRGQGWCSACLGLRFNLERHTEGFLFGLFSKQLYTFRFGGGGDEKQCKTTGLSFCLIVNELIDKQGFSPSVRMKHKQALQPRTGVVGE